MKQAELKNIVRKMIQIEFDAMHYYRMATKSMQDEGAIFHFSILADEELEHARSFYQIYPGEDLPPFDEMLEKSGGNSAIAQSVDIGLVARLDERQALQLAMKLEKEVEGNLRKMVADVKNPEARAVIEKNAVSTLNHYEMIEADYLRLYADKD